MTRSEGRLMSDYQGLDLAHSGWLDADTNLSRKGQTSFGQAKVKILSSHGEHLGIVLAVALVGTLDGPEPKLFKQPPRLRRQEQDGLVLEECSPHFPRPMNGTPPSKGQAASRN
jgi:hypothetical protein